MRRRGTQFDKNAFLSSYKWFLGGGSNFEKLVSSEPLMLSMPIDDEYVLNLIYLKKSNAVDESIRLGELTIAEHS